MSLPIDKELVTQAVVVFSACFGGWMALVQPKADAVRASEINIATYESQIRAQDTLVLDGMADKAPALRSRTEEIAGRNAFAGDSSVLYGRIMSLAKELDVQVKNMRPGMERKVGRDDVIAVTRIDVTVEGEYERMARFLDGLNGIEAYLRQTSVQISPTKRQDNDIAIMQLGFEAVRFTLPKAVTELRGMKP